MYIMKRFPVSKNVLTENSHSLYDSTVTDDVAVVK